MYIGNTDLTLQRLLFRGTISDDCVVYYQFGSCSTHRYSHEPIIMRLLALFDTCLLNLRLHDFFISLA